MKTFTVGYLTGKKFSVENLFFPVNYYFPLTIIFSLSNAHFPLSKIDRETRTHHHLARRLSKKFQFILSTCDSGNANGLIDSLPYNFVFVNDGLDADDIHQGELGDWWYKRRGILSGKLKSHKLTKKTHSLEFGFSND